MTKEGVRKKTFEIKAYKSTSKCEACGGDKVTIKYRTEKEETGRPEHLKKVCDSCGFTWREHPKWANKAKDL